MFLVHSVFYYSLECLVILGHLEYLFYSISDTLAKLLTISSRSAKLWILVVSIVFSVWARFLRNSDSLSLFLTTMLLMLWLFSS